MSGRAVLRVRVAALIAAGERRGLGWRACPSVVGQIAEEIAQIAEQAHR